MDNLARDIAHGNGEYLNTFAALGFPRQFAPTSTAASKPASPASIVLFYPGTAR